MIDDGSDVRSPLAGTETIVRYVGGAHIDSGTGRINGSAFERPEKDRDGVSVSRRGIFAAAQEPDRHAIRVVTASRMKLGKTAIFAELRVDAALSCLKEFEDHIAICTDPLHAEGECLANPAHALIVGLPLKGEAVGSLKSEVAGDRLRHVVHDRFPAAVE